MSRSIKQPNIEYKQLQDGGYISRVDEAFFILFDEMIRIRELKKAEKIKKTYPLTEKGIVDNLV